MISIYCSDITDTFSAHIYLVKCRPKEVLRPLLENWLGESGLFLCCKIIRNAILGLVRYTVHFTATIFTKFLHETEAEAKKIATAFHFFFIFLALVF